MPHRPVVPWDAILTGGEMKAVTALCDVIIPEDDISPSASAVGVPEFINEWVSAPYPDQQRDLQTVRGGLVWLNTESDLSIADPKTCRLRRPVDQ